jgi:hypothetical protein
MQKPYSPTNNLSILLGMAMYRPAITVHKRNCDRSRMSLDSAIQAKNTTPAATAEPSSRV